jgi:hypothetical protein
MVRPSFVPPPQIRELREVTRYRKTQVDARAREIQRLEKVLQDAGIKLTSVASRAWSASSREIIEALISGVRDPAVLAQLAKGRMRAKIANLEEALSGHFGSHHAIVCRQIIDHIDLLDRAIAALTEEVTTRRAGEPRVRRKATTGGHPEGCAVAATCAHRIGPCRSAHEGHLPLGAVHAHRAPARREQSCRRSRELDALCGLASAEHGCLVRRPGRGLLRAPS